MTNAGCTRAGKWVFLLLFGLVACGEVVSNRDQHKAFSDLAGFDSLSDQRSWNSEMRNFMLRSRGHYNTILPTTYPLRMLYADPLSDHLWNPDIWKDSL